MMGMKRMGNRILHGFASWQSALLMLVLYAGMLGGATFVEHLHGTQAARQWIYHHPFFILFQLLMVVQFFLLSVRVCLWQRRKWGTWILHVAWIVILSGALCTHLWGYEGLIHLREGESTSSLQLSDGVCELPFSVRLDDFRLVRYPGSHSPSSYESFLTITDADGPVQEHIYMNKVIYRQGYRIYQSSYDPDEQGSVLSVNHDSLGTGITYGGYLLLLIGLIAVLAEPSSRFRQLLGQLKQGVPLCVLLLLPAGMDAASNKVDAPVYHTISDRQAQVWSRMQVQCPTGRVEPMNTYAAKLLRKLCRQNSYEGLAPEQVILGFLVDPPYWCNVPLIRQKNTELARMCGLPASSFLRFSDLFDDRGAYRLTDAVERAYARPFAERTSLDKDLLKLDEKANILYALQQGQMMPLFPLADDSDGRWYSPGDDLSLFSGRDSLFVTKIFGWYLSEVRQALDTGEWANADEVLSMMDVYQQKRSTSGLLSAVQVKWELFYNRASIFSRSGIVYMAAGFLLLLCAVIGWLKSGRWLRVCLLLLVCLLVATFLAHTCGIGIRWYISGRAPWANAYESMIYVAWATALAGMLFIRRSTVTFALAGFFAGIILFVANLNFMDPEITPLVPVLKSYWLMIHVAVITASYGFFGISFLIGLLCLLFLSWKDSAAVWTNRVRELRIVNELSLHIGLCLLAAGIFLGAVWANESWGRYWGWDPKETWALVTMIVYAFVVHARFVPLLRSDYAFSVMSVFAFASVLMTYFGVNFYLSGLHSYGSSDAPAGVQIVFVVFGVALALSLWAGWRRRV